MTFEEALESVEMLAPKNAVSKEGILTRNIKGNPIQMVRRTQEEANSVAMGGCVGFFLLKMMPNLSIDKVAGVMMQAFGWEGTNYREACEFHYQLCMEKYPTSDQIAGA